MKPNQKALDDKEPTITLAGVAWPIPKLTLGQNRKLQVPFAKAAAKIMVEGTRVLELTEDEVDALVEIVFVALTRAHPEFTRAELDDMTVSVAELVAAFLTVAAQSGLWNAPKGEATGAENPPTGTA